MSPKCKSGFPITRPAQVCSSSPSSLFQCNNAQEWCDISEYYKCEGGDGGINLSVFSWEGYIRVPFMALKARVDKSIAILEAWSDKLSLISASERK